MKKQYRGGGGGGGGQKGGGGGGGKWEGGGGVEGELIPQCTLWHICKIVYKCDKSLAQIKLLTTGDYHLFNKYTNAGTLMQIWKSPYMLVVMYKQCSESFAFLIIRILELLSCEGCKYLKK